MSISVVCPGCKKRFKVSDQFAGRKGPCPNCKVTIAIPEKTAEIVIHDPTKGAPGSATEARRKISEPVFLEEFKVGVLDYVGLAVSVIGWVGGLIAYRAIWPFVGGLNPNSRLAQLDPRNLPTPTVPWWALAVGAVAIAVPVAILGYRFFRDLERGRFTTSELTPRVAATIAALPLIWLMPVLLRTALAYDTNVPLEVYFGVVLGPLMLAAATGIPLLTYEWLVGRALALGGFYFVLTILSRVLLGLAPFG